MSEEIKNEVQEQYLQSESNMNAFKIILSYVIDITYNRFYVLQEIIFGLCNMQRM